MTIDVPYLLRIKDIIRRSSLKIYLEYYNLYYFQLFSS